MSTLPNRTMFWTEEHDTMMCHRAMEKLGEAQKPKVRSPGRDTLLKYITAR